MVLTKTLLQNLREHIQATIRSPIRIDLTGESEKYGYTENPY